MVNQKPDRNQQRCLNCEYCIFAVGRTDRFVGIRCERGLNNRPTDILYWCKKWEPNHDWLVIETLTSSDEMVQFVPEQTIRGMDPETYRKIEQNWKPEG